MARPKGSQDKQPRKPRTDEANKRPKGCTIQVDPDMDYNRNTIAFLRAITPDTPLDPNNVQMMRERFWHFLDMCDMYGKRPGNMKAYMAIGIDPRRATEWEADERNPERSEFIKNVRIFCGSYREDLAETGEIPVPIAIFWQKNYDGLKDVTEKVEVKVDATAPQLIDKIAEKYLPDEQK